MHQHAFETHLKKPHEGAIYTLQLLNAVSISISLPPPVSNPSPSLCYSPLSVCLFLSLQPALLHSQIVVLGGNGELGSYLCPKLAQLGHEVFAVCNDDLPPYTPADEWDKITTLVHNRTSMDQESAGSYGSAVAALQVS